MKNNLLKITEVIIASWILSKPAPADNSFPLDEDLTYALEKASKLGILPPFFSGNIHFVDGQTGRICLELPEIHQIAMETKLLEYDSSFVRATLAANENVALHMSQFTEIPRENLVFLGKRLRRLVTEGISERRQALAA